MVIRIAKASPFALESFQGIVRLTGMVLVGIGIRGNAMNAECNIRECDGNGGGHKVEVIKEIRRYRNHIMSFYFCEACWKSRHSRLDPSWEDLEKLSAFKEIDETL